MGFQADAQEMIELIGLEGREAKDALPQIKRALKKHADELKGLDAKAKLDKLNEIMRGKAEPAPPPPPAAPPAPAAKNPPAKETEGDTEPAPAAPAAPEKIETNDEETLETGVKDEEPTDPATGKPADSAE